ncbi:hypothetical protein CPB86DRAFT_809594 [Serendipita vermifera]|nr:hypothetical protein CPB86DRAFT_809594 [Serendipita vermifera]
MDDIYARFNPNPNKIAAWNRLLMLGSSSTAVTAKGDPTPQQQQKPTPDVLYDRAITVLVELKEDLLRLGWSEIPKERLPPGLLFMIEGPLDSPASSRGAIASRRATPPRSAAGAPSRVPPFTGRLLPTPAASPETQPGSSSTLAYSSYFDSDVTTSATEMGTEETDSSGFTSSPRVTFCLPAELSAFLEFHQEIESALHDARLFTPILDRQNSLVLATGEGVDRTLAPAPLRDIFYLLQLIAPGMFLLVHDSLTFSTDRGFSLAIPSPATQHNRPTHLNADSRENSQASSTKSVRVLLRRTRRALPPAEWMTSRTEMLESVLGRHLLHELLCCAQDVELTTWRTVHGPDEDEFETGSDAGFDPSSPLTPSWSPDEIDQNEFLASIPIPFASPGAVARNRRVDRARLTQSL